MGKQGNISNDEREGQKEKVGNVLCHDFRSKESHHDPVESL